MRPKISRPQFLSQKNLRQQMHVSRHLLICDKSTQMVWNALLGACPFLFDTLLNQTSWDLMQILWMSKVTKTQLSLFAVSDFICVLMLNTIIECQFETMSKKCHLLSEFERKLLQLVQQYIAYLKGSIISIIWLVLCSLAPAPSKNTQLLALAESLLFLPEKLFNR